MSWGCNDFYSPSFLSALDDWITREDDSYEYEDEEEYEEELDEED